ncbi:hypothetical protein RCH09_003928, partial [Actimicrobium sp. GrIS 1.19]|uniref:hypothetical protein n=1 Tax=Actimicrobium sp. GrIS 1.19 TaxID=3071708 RepID=UPI002DFD33EF|nr:hypothetical protein [Actimicrobium sp. GrIS 1.19]
QGSSEKPPSSQIKSVYQISIAALCQITSAADTPPVNPSNPQNKTTRRNKKNHVSFHSCFSVGGGGVGFS